MKKTLSTTEAAHELASNKDNGFSYAGAYALIEWIEEIDDCSGTETELDCIALRCEFTEYESTRQAADEYDCLQRDIEENTVAEFDGGIIVHNF